MLKVTLRGLLAHKVRFIATALAVLLGVAFMAGTQVFTDTFSKSFDQIFVDVDKGIDAVVRSSVVVKSDFGDQRSRISETVVPTVRAGRRRGRPPTASSRATCASSTSPARPWAIPTPGRRRSA